MPFQTFGAIFAIVLFVGACASDAPRMAAYESPVSDADWARMTEGMDAFMSRVEALEAFPPGAAVVMTTGDGRRYIRVHGELKSGAGFAATPDSAFYIASMTKAYMGLLAARLDAEGVLKLESTLADYWPDLRLPAEGRQADQVTLHDLLHHKLPFEADEIAYLEAYVRDVAPQEYPVLIEKYAQTKEDAYDYANVGYNIYAAILQQETGKNWRDWLREKVFSPLGLNATSGRTSDYRESEIAWSHMRASDFQDAWPRHNGLYLVPPKTDGMMQSAGGLMTSASDMALWMQAHLRGAGPARSGLTPELFARVRQRGASYEGDGHGFSCDGYAFGWNLCELLIDAEEDFTGEDKTLGPFLQHGGGYIGVRSLMTVSPELGVGVAFLSNADTMTGYLSNEIAKLALELLAGLPGDEARAHRRLQRYADQNERYFAFLQNRRDEARTDERWGGWTWRPAPAALRAYHGVFESDGLLSPVTIERVDNALRARSGERVFRLEPAAPDLFSAQSFAYDEMTPVRFIRDEADRVIAVEIDDVRYERR